eukprot:CAMPEP_0172440248 /NCGR_PEP_ID=MMETSP1065-20121228/938_1 /TAXON_ID=265537 /ORGANISM="Amphiprora paludosa, Strain CCMP125" /LENGTH=832 /DNA_ID=CAMNT_0013189035 /DNA_START=101 /DNA_END=2599 /DNA_ORIENTATION=-
MKSINFQRALMLVAFAFTTMPLVSAQGPSNTRRYLFDPFILDLDMTVPFECELYGMAEQIRNIAEDALRDYVKPHCGLDPVATFMGGRSCAGPQAILIDGGMMEFPRGLAISYHEISNCVEAAMQSDLMMSKLKQKYAFITDVVYRLPTASPTETPTTSAPTTAKPTEAPTTTKPTINPTTSPTTAHPTAPPTESPSTSQPTVSPTTAEPTLQPVPLLPGETRAPTNPPTTALPTKAPTLPPTILPTTSSPTTLSPTPQPTAATLDQDPTTKPPTASPTQQPVSSTTNNNNDDDDDDDDDDDIGNSEGGGTSVDALKDVPSASSSSSSGNIAVVAGALAGLAMVLFFLVCFAQKRRQRWKKELAVTAAEGGFDLGQEQDPAVFDIEEAMSESYNSGVIYHNVRPKQLGQAQQQMESTYPTKAPPSTPSRNRMTAAEESLYGGNKSTAASSDAGSRTSSSRLERMLAAGASVARQILHTNTNDGEHSGSTPNTSVEEDAEVDVDQDDDASDGDLAEEPHVMPLPPGGYARATMTRTTTSSARSSLHPNEMASPTIIRSRSMTCPIVLNTSSQTMAAVPSTSTASIRMSPVAPAHAAAGKTVAPAASTKSTPTVVMNPFLKSNVAAASPKRVVSPPRSFVEQRNSALSPNRDDMLSLSSVGSSAFATTSGPQVMSVAAVMPPPTTSMNARDNTLKSTISVEEIPIRRRGHNRVPSPISNAFFPSISKYNSDMESGDEEEYDRESEGTFEDQDAFAPDQSWDPDDNEVTVSEGGDVAFLDQLRKQIKSGNRQEARSMLRGTPSTKTVMSPSKPPLSISKKQQSVWSDRREQKTSL